MKKDLRPNLVSFGREQTVEREKREGEKKKRKRRRREAKQKGMETNLEYGTIWFCMDFYGFL